MTINDFKKFIEKNQCQKVDLFRYHKGKLSSCEFFSSWDKECISYGQFAYGRNYNYRMWLKDLCIKDSKTIEYIDMENFYIYKFY